MPLLSNRRKLAYRKGKNAEWLAAIYLQIKGYEILKRRYKTPMGEIDLLVQRGHVLIAVEVKMRNTIEQASLAITTSQKRRIERSLLFYLAGKKSTLDLRFDVILMSPWRWPYHIQGAWLVN